MSKILRAWPVAGAVFFLIYDNKFLLPWLMYWDAGVVTYFVAPQVMCVIELSYFWWFIGWLGRRGSELPEVRQVVAEFWDRGFGRHIARLVPEIRDLAVAMWDWMHGFVNQALAHKTGKDRWLMRAAKGVLALAKLGPNSLVYPELVGLGCLPFGWVVGIPLCRTRKIPYGFLVLVLANMISTAAVAALGYGPLYLLFGTR